MSDDSEERTGLAHLARESRVDGQAPRLIGEPLWLPKKIPRELKSPALYLGTTTGQLWIGREGGEEWSCLFDSLPPIHCVKAAMV